MAKLTKPPFEAQKKGKCQYCGKTKTDLYHKDNLWVCQECYDAAEICDECGSIFMKGQFEFIEMEDGSKICELCAAISEASNIKQNQGDPLTKILHG